MKIAGDRVDDMSTVSARMKWAGGLKFDGKSVFGHGISTDGAVKAGGTEAGYKPTELLLFGVAGCTGIDVIRILTKMRQEVESMEIEVIGYQNDDYPKPFHTVEIKLKVGGINLNPDKIKQAMELSEEKYCVVSQTIKEVGQIKCSFEIV
jgi:putative redox protein